MSRRMVMGFDGPREVDWADSLSVGGYPIPRRTHEPLPVAAFMDRVKTLELIEAGVARRLARLSTHALLLRRRHLSWSWRDDHDPGIPDYTSGLKAWPACCDARGLANHYGPGYTCTRRAHHTGRHAAGAGGRIVAVWGDRP